MTKPVVDRVRDRIAQVAKSGQAVADGARVAADQAVTDRDATANAGQEGGKP